MKLQIAAATVSTARTQNPALVFIIYYQRKESITKRIQDFQSS